MNPDDVKTYATPPRGVRPDARIDLWVVGVGRNTDNEVGLDREGFYHTFGDAVTAAKRINPRWMPFVAQVVAK